MKQTFLTNCEKFLTPSLKIGLALALFTPLIISSSTYFPFVVGKAIAFQIIVEVLLFLYFLLIIVAPRFRPKLTALTWAILAYFFIVTLASILGIDFKFSFWTNYERMDGLFNLYHFGIYAFLLSAMFRKKQDWLWFFRILLGTLIVIDILGLFQKLGISSLSKLGGDRAFSTLGNATYMGTQAVFQFFIALFLLLSDRKLIWRLYYLLNGILGLGAILISQTRGGMLGIFLGGVIFLTLGGLFSQRRKLFIIIFGSIVLLIGLSFFLFSHPEWRITKILPERLNVFSTSLNLDTRGVVWGISANAWKARFLLGWGTASHGFVFAPFYNPKAASYEDVWFDKPHNKILEVGVDSGIIGVLGYISILVIAIYFIWKKRAMLGDGAFGLIALVTAYLIQNIFLFDFQASYLWWYALLGFVNFLIFKDGEETIAKGNDQNRNYYFAFFLIGALILGFCFVKGNILPLTAACQGIQALRSEYQGVATDKVLSAYKSVLALGTFGNTEILSEMIKALNSIGQKINKNDFTAYLDFMQTGEEKIYHERPYDFKNALILGSLYKLRSQSDINYLEKAKTVYEDFLKKAPNKFEPYFELAIIDFAQAHYEEMLNYLNEAINLNLRYYRSYWEAARIHFLGGQKDKGRIYLAASIQNGLPWNFLISANFLKKEDNEWFIRVLTRFQKNESNHSWPQLLLAGFYGNMQDKDAMMLHLREAAKIDPSYVTSVVKQVLGINL